MRERFIAILLFGECEQSCPSAGGGAWVSFTAKVIAVNHDLKRDRSPVFGSVTKGID